MARASSPSADRLFVLHASDQAGEPSVACISALTPGQYLREVYHLPPADSAADTNDPAASENEIKTLALLTAAGTATHGSLHACYCPWSSLLLSALMCLIGPRESLSSLSAEQEEKVDSIAAAQSVDVFSSIKFALHFAVGREQSLERACLLGLPSLVWSALLSPPSCVRVSVFARVLSGFGPARSHYPPGTYRYLRAHTCTPYPAARAGEAGGGERSERAR